MLAACDRPDCHFIPPGRSGPELITRLVELQKFAAKEEVFNPDPYVGHADAKPAPTQAVGRIQEEHRFASAEKFNAINPYRSLDVGGLKLSGEGR